MTPTRHVVERAEERGVFQDLSTVSEKGTQHWKGGQCCVMYFNIRLIIKDEKGITVFTKPSPPDLGCR